LMGRSKQDIAHKKRRARNAGGRGPAQTRPMQGMDTKEFTFNDIRPLSVPNP
jgi:hypothetical protein